MEKMDNPVALFAGMKVTIMGLGLNGGGLESARFLALRGAECTVTDMKDEKTLAPSIEKLLSLSEPHPPFRFVLGKHEMDDFTKADMVVKNPAVRPDSPYLAGARRIETDISLFLAALQPGKKTLTKSDSVSPTGKAYSPFRLIAVTGSKGKSITASAVHWVLAKAREAALLPGRAFLGGNITVSPLRFLDELGEPDDIVLELSSWQLADLKGRTLLKPRAAIITSIMPDHQDRYGSMEEYVNDKRIIYQGQDKEDSTIACADDPWGMSFLSQTPGRPLPYSAKPMAPKTEPGAFIDPESGAGMIKHNGALSEAVPPHLLVPGRHNKKNCLAAALALFDLGLPLSFIRESLAGFPGIEHRLEFFWEINGIRFYNDTAATIPEAAAAAIETFTADCGEKTPLVLVTGGADKNLDFSPLVRAILTALKNEISLDIILLAGMGSNTLIVLLKEAGIPYHGPFDSISEAAQAAFETGRRTAPSVVVLSPGCASFGMFANEFDRGRQWKETVLTFT